MVSFLVLGTDLLEVGAEKEVAADYGDEADVVCSREVSEGAGEVVGDSRLEATEHEGWGEGFFFVGHFLYFPSGGEVG